MTYADPMLQNDRLALRVVTSSGAEHEVQATEKRFPGVAHDDKGRFCGHNRRKVNIVR